MKTLLTLDVLKTMSSDELEDYRAAGEDFRRELSHAVMRDLTSPSGWSVNAEYRCEFGGFFPVQIRFTPPHGHFDVAVCSSGELNPRWIVVFVTRDGQPFSVVRVMMHSTLNSSPILWISSSVLTPVATRLPASSARCHRRAHNDPVIQCSCIPENQPVRQRCRPS